MVGINTNISAMFAQKNLSSSNTASSASISKLSSGNRITRAADDVAGLSVGTILRTTVSTLKTALSNTQQANSLLSVADGGLKNIGEILQRQKSLAVQATSGTLSASERGFLNQEFQNLTAEIDRLVENTKFNQVTLLNGSIYDDANIKTNTNTITAGTAAIATLAIAANDEYNGTNAELKAGVAAGEVDALVNAITPAAAGTSGFNADAVINNPAFVGDLGGAKFEVEFVAANNVSVSITVGDFVYRGNIANTAAAGATVLTGFEVGDPATAGGGTFELNLAALAVADPAGAETFETRLNSALSKVSFFQTRTLDLDESGALAGTTAVVRLDNFEDVRVEDIRVDAADGTNTGTIEFIINGDSYRATIPANGTYAADANITLLKNADAASNERIVFDWVAGSAATTGNLTNGTAAKDFEDALKAAFRVGTGNTSLTFQTGNQVADNIEVQVKSVDSTALGTSSLNILDVASAQAASAALDVAINKVTAIRADVGALQSRFDYAAANLETTIQNTDAAKSTFLDADISEESTKYATAQVTLQASISVLAQANQLPQNLLKLIG